MIVHINVSNNLELASVRVKHIAVVSTVLTVLALFKVGFTPADITTPRSIHQAFLTYSRP